MRWEGGKANHEVDLDWIKAQFNQPQVYQMLLSMSANAAADGADSRQTMVSTLQSGGRVDSSNNMVNLTFQNTQDAVSYDFRKKKLIVMAPWR